jgi:hypothetical protein
LTILGTTTEPEKTKKIKIQGWKFLKAVCLLHVHKKLALKLCWGYCFCLFFLKLKFFFYFWTTTRWCKIISCCTTNLKKGTETFFLNKVISSQKKQKKATKQNMFFVPFWVLYLSLSWWEKKWGLFWPFSFWSQENKISLDVKESCSFSSVTYVVTTRLKERKWAKYFSEEELLSDEILRFFCLRYEAYRGNNSKLCGHHVVGILPILFGKI